MGDDYGQSHGGSGVLWRGRGDKNGVTVVSPLVSPTDSHSQVRGIWGSGVSGTVHFGYCFCAFELSLIFYLFGVLLTLESGAQLSEVALTFFTSCLLTRLSNLLITSFLMLSLHVHCKSF